MQKHIVIVHGLSASPESNWFMWLKKKAESAGCRVSVPAMPDSSNPDPDAWLAHLAKIIPVVDESVFFVGHSLGCITVAHFLQGLEEGQRAGGCVFVAGFSGNINNPKTCAFYQRALDFERVKARSGPVISIFSEDDPTVPLVRAQEFSAQLGGKSMIVQGMGHFVGSQGVTELPVAFEALSDLMNRS